MPPTPPLPLRERGGWGVRAEWRPYTAVNFITEIRPAIWRATLRKTSA